MNVHSTVEQLNVQNVLMQAKHPQMEFVKRLPVQVDNIIKMQHAMLVQVINIARHVNMRIPSSYVLIVNLELLIMVSVNSLFFRVLQVSMLKVPLVILARLPVTVEPVRKELIQKLNV